jgi:hypothetical protein
VNLAVLDSRDEVVQGAIRIAEVRGLNFVSVRDPLTNTQHIAPLPTFSCSTKDHSDLAVHTAATICEVCKHPLYSKDGMRKIETQADIESVLTDLEQQLSRDLSVEQRSNLLATKAAYLGCIGRGVEMLATSEQAHALHRSAESNRALANALFLNGRALEMEPLLREVTSFPPVAWMDCLHHATSLRYHGRVHEAAEIERKHHCSAARYLPYWDGNPCDHLHIFIDDGFGDAIYVMRFLSAIKARGVEEITICVPPQYGEGLAALFRGQSWMPKVVMYPKDFSKLRKEIKCAIAASDIDCTLDLDLSPTPRQPLWTSHHMARTKYRKLRNGKPLVGICWSAKQQAQRLVGGGVMRSLTDAQVRQIVSSIPGVQWVNLQYKQEPPTPKILSPKVETWRDTAGIVHNLDAVVSVDTAVMHLAEAMRKPTFVLSSGASDWRIHFAHTIYPSAKVFQNRRFGFDDAISALIQELNKWKLNHAITANTFD